MNNLEYALRLASLNREKDQIEQEIKQLKAELLESFPSIADGYSPEYFTVSVGERVTVTDPCKALDYLLSHPEHQVLFKLSCNKGDFQRMGSPGFAEIKKDAPTIKVNVGLMKTATAAVADESLAA